MRNIIKYLIFCYLILFENLITVISNEYKYTSNIKNNTQKYNLLNNNENFEDVEFDWKGRIVVIGDIHGDIKSLISTLYLSGLINKDLNWIGKDTLLIQLGDIVDRGHYALQIYKLFYKLSIQAPLLNSKIIGLLGNHEIMNMCGQFQYVSEEDYETYGGKENRIYEWSDQGFIGNYLRTLKLAIRVNDSLYVHAGLTPKYAKMGLKHLGKLTHDLLKSNFCDNYSSIFFIEDGPLWTRDISLNEEKVACNLVDESLNLLKLERMVVGHTIQMNNRINVKCNNKLYLIDTGFSEAIYGKPCLLELMYYKNETELSNNRSKYSYFIPYSINELILKDDIIKKNIKYIHVHNLFYKNHTLIHETIKKDEL